MVTFLAFFAVHMIMVASTHFSRNLNAITLDQNKYNLNGVVLTLLAYAVLIGLNVWAVRFSWTHTRVLQKISNMTVGRVMDLLFDHYGPRAEYREKDISPYFWPNGLVPTSEDWTPLKDEEFRDYRVKVHGLVENPVELSLEDLREMGRRDQITMHNCIQGWSAIGKWSGLALHQSDRSGQTVPGGEVGDVLLLRRGRRGRASTTTRTRSKTSTITRACSPMR